jgi:hypothetical protein
MSKKNMRLRLKKFDMRNIADDKTVVMIGKRGTGKSFLIKDLLYHHQDIPLGIVVSGTEGANEFYKNIVPPQFIHPKVTDDLLGNITSRQSKITKRVKKEENLYGSTKIDPRMFLILDDCLYDDSWAKKVDIRGYFMNGRHYKMLFIITMQYPLGIPPALRTNIDYVFILRENINKNKERIFESYAGIFPTYNLFSQVMDQCTENYECLVIDNTSKSNKLEDVVYWYKGEEHEDFKLGLSQFWISVKEDEESSDDDIDFDTSAISPTKKGPQIKVKKY